MYDTLSKRLLFLAAAAIVVVTLGYTQHLSSIIREEEQRKVDLWVEAVKQRAELVTYTQTLFEDLGAEEKKRADRLASAYRLIQEAPDGTDLTFAGDFLVNNNTVPVLITNKAGEVVYKVNVDPPPAGVAERAYYDSIRRTQMSRNPPIRFEEVGQTIYYAESVRLRKLREAMDELIESQPKALAGHIPDVVGFCVEVASAPGLESVTRRRALDVIAFLARYKPKALLRAKLVAPLLRVLCPLCGEPKEEQLAGDDDAGEAAEEEMHVQTVAAQLVDLLAIKVPAKHVLPEVLSFASPAISDADPKRRHAATACLGIVAEGCAEGLSKVAPDVTPLVVRALRDPSPDVRGAAAFLGQFNRTFHGRLVT